MNELEKLKKAAFEKLGHDEYEKLRPDIEEIFAAGNGYRESFNQAEYPDLDFDRDSYKQQARKHLDAALSKTDNDNSIKYLEHLHSHLIN